MHKNMLKNQEIVVSLSSRERGIRSYIFYICAYPPPVLCLCIFFVHRFSSNAVAKKMSKVVLYVVRRENNKYQTWHILLIEIV
jgi:hypothetical protein